MNLCCDKPNLVFDWKLGFEDDTQKHLHMGLENVRCKNCEARYYFDTREGAACPMTQTMDNGKGALIRVFYIKAVLQ